MGHTREKILRIIQNNESGGDILRLLNKRLDAFLDWAICDGNYSNEMDIVNVWITFEKSIPRFPSRKLREKILVKFNFICQYCGATESKCIDHIIPYSLGGKTLEENLQVLCKSCNSKKRDKVGYELYN
jgi:hypothetical protein